MTVGAWLIPAALSIGSATAAWSWQANHYDAELARQALNHQSDLTSIGNAASAQSRVQQAEHLALLLRLSKADEMHHLELTRAQDDQKRIRDRLATADLRLSVLLAQSAAIGADDLSSGTAAGSLVHGAQRAQLDPAHAQRIVAITDDGDEAVIALGACQAYVREITATP